jgi:hypothetical protein
VRPFRLAAFELTAPLAGLEVALGAAAALTEVLEPPLGQLDVSPFGSLFVADPGAPAAGGTRSAAAKARVRGPAAQGRSASPRAPSSSPPAPASAGGFGGIAKALEEIQRDIAVSQAAERVVPGTGTAAVALARGARAARELPLLGELAETAFDAVARAAPAPTGGGRLARDLAGSASRTERPRGSRPGRAPSPAGGGFGGIARALEQLQRVAAVSAAAEQVLPGTGRAAVAVAHGAQAATTLLEQLAETALQAVAPRAAAPGAVASARKPRTDASEAVRRELDAGATRPGRPAPATPARAAGPRDGASPERDGVRPPEPADPAELAWLVNEALVEQARRHGVDLS